MWKKVESKVLSHSKYYKNTIIFVNIHKIDDIIIQ